MTIDTDLATLRAYLDKPWCPNLGSCPPEMHSGCSYCAVHEDAEAAHKNVEAEVARLREAESQARYYREQAEDRSEAAERELARLQDGLREPLGLLQGIDYDEGSRIDRAVEAIDALLADTLEDEQ